MRTEFTIICTYPNGKKSFSQYPKKYYDLAFFEFKKAKHIYEPQGVKVEFFEIVYYGSSYHHSRKIA